MRGNFRIATPADLPTLEAWDIDFAYKTTLAEEIGGPYARHFRWMLYEEDGRVVAYHRSKLTSGWATWSGVLAASRRMDGRILTQLVRHVFDDLCTLPLSGQIAWTNDPTSPKALFLRRLGFALYPEPVHHLIFRGASLAVLCGLAGVGEASAWRPAREGDRASILALAEEIPTSVNLDAEYLTDGFSQWLVKEGAGGLDAALNWWQLGRSIELPFALVRLGVMDLTEGLALLPARWGLGPIERLRIHLDHAYSLDLIRLLTLRPMVFSPTAGVSLFRLPAGGAA